MHMIQHTLKQSVKHHSSEHGLQLSSKRREVFSEPCPGVVTWLVQVCAEGMRAKKDSHVWIRILRGFRGTVTASDFDFYSHFDFDFYFDFYFESDADSDFVFDIDSEFNFDFDFDSEIDSKFDINFDSFSEFDTEFDIDFEFDSEVDLSHLRFCSPTFTNISIFPIYFMIFLYVICRRHTMTLRDN